MKLKDLPIGKKINMLTVIDYVSEINNKGHVIQKIVVRCDCGNEKVILPGSLPNIKSCGCYRRKKYEGMRFGFLTVEEAIRERNKNGTWVTRWRCKCDCGNETIVLDTNLKRGYVKSCGCMSSKMISQSRIKTNKYDLSGSYGIGYTYNVDSKNRNYFYFDLEDYDLIKEYCWYFNAHDYLIARDREIGSQKRLLMHRVVTGYEKHVDHIGGNRYDNRKGLLREATKSQNAMNSKRASNNVTGHNGIVFNKQYHSWYVHININKKSTYLGAFKTYEDALRVRLEAEKKYYGEYSYDSSQELARQIGSSL